MQPAAAQVPLPTGGPSASSASMDSSDSVNTEPAQTHSTKAPGFVVPPPSFSYAVHGDANVNPTISIGGMNQSVPPPIMHHPGPGISPNTGASFSYNVPQTGSSVPGKLLLQVTSSLGAADQDSGITKPESLPGPPQSGGNVVSSTATDVRPTWQSGLPPFSSYSARPVAPVTPGPPGLAPYTPVAPGAARLSVASDSSVTMRSNLAGFSVLPTPAFQQQVFSPYPSLAPTTANPQGLWLQPPQISGMARPPFMQYPAVFPSPLPFPGQGITPSMTLPDPRFVTPPGTAGGLPSFSVSNQQLAGPSTIPVQTRAPADTSKDGNSISSKDGVTGSEPLEAWTAHKAESGIAYYYNALTGKSTYERPSGFKLDDVATQPVPVTMEKVANTDWEIVRMNDGKKYYFNTKTKISSWQIPTEVSELMVRQESVQLKENVSRPDVNLSSEKVSASISLSAPVISTGGREAAALRITSLLGTPSALDLVKKKLQDAGTPGSSNPVSASAVGTTQELNGSRTNEVTGKDLQSENNKDKLKEANGNDSISDSSSDSEDADTGPTKQELVLQFKEMLKELGVAPFSKWDKELPKILFDPRFKAIPSYSERRSLFEHFVKTRAEEERKEKRAAQKAAIEGFKQLLEEASEDIDASTDYHTFRKTWGNDPRFEALDRKDRENLLKERVLPLKKATEQKAQAIRDAAASSFKSMLQDKEDITVNSRWSRVKDGLRDDPRYKSVKHEDREALFNDYIAELKDTERRLEQEAKAKKDEQGKLKERERETRKRKEREEQEMERVRQKVRKKEAVESFQALLVESIKDPQISWTEAKLKLDKDPQGRASNPDLSTSETEKLFREHIKMLYERCLNDFKALLAETIATGGAEATALEEKDRRTAINSWSTAKLVLKSDPRYNRMPRKEREVVWRRHAEELLRKRNTEVDNNDKSIEKKQQQHTVVVDANTKGRSSIIGDPERRLHSTTSSSSGSKRSRDRR